MDWVKGLIAGVVAGILVWIWNFLAHGIILSATYERYPVFSQEAASPLLFYAVGALMTIPAALLFSRTRKCWAEGIAGGISFGFWIGLLTYFADFYNPMVIEGFPYFLSWCWGGINLIGWLAFGAITGLIVKGE